MSDANIISKTTYTFVVLHRTDQPPTSLHDAIEEAYGGHAVGWETEESTVPVANENVPAELRELGNDGEFFDDDLEEEE